MHIWSCNKVDSYQRTSTPVDAAAMLLALTTLCGATLGAEGVLENSAGASMRALPSDINAFALQSSITA